MKDDLKTLAEIPGLIKSPEWELEITSFRGISPGAFHYYGDISRQLFVPHPDGGTYNDREKVRLSHLLTESEVADLRKPRFSLSGMFDGGDPFDWKVGDHYTGFWTKEDVFAALREYFHVVADEGDFVTYYDFEADEDIVIVGTKREWDEPGGTCHYGHGSPFSGLYFNTDLEDYL